VENLSAIPGTVGALPIQNVGAYGQEASEVVESVEVLDRRTLEGSSLPARDCGFAYRRSIFNTSAKGRWIVTSVIFRLRKQGRPVIQYRSIQDWLAVHDRHLARKALRRLRRWPLFRALPADAAGGFSAADMRRCITAIRSDGRLPDVRTLGNVGSFFKNTILSAEQYETALARANVCLGPAAVNAIRATAVGLDNGRSIKVETGRLIIQSGAQKFRRGGAALYSRNPIVVVNASGAATAADVLGLAEDVRRRVHECTGIQIPIEPERVGFES
jgi:UDP-N-acetylmuramate dehydrogenase